VHELSTDGSAVDAFETSHDFAQRKRLLLKKEETKIVFMLVRTDGHGPESRLSFLAGQSSHVEENAV
jgi:hypothetical protein